MPVKRALAWCHQCGAVVFAEEWPRDDSGGFGACPECGDDYSRFTRSLWHITRPMMERSRTSYGELCLMALQRPRGEWWG